MEFSSLYAGVLQRCARFESMSGLNENNVTAAACPGERNCWLWEELSARPRMFGLSLDGKLPNAFPRCGYRIYGVFPSRELRGAVFLCFSESPRCEMCGRKEAGVVSI